MCFTHTNHNSLNIHSNVFLWKYSPRIFMYIKLLSNCLFIIINRIIVRVSEACLQLIDILLWVMLFCTLRPNAFGIFSFYGQIPSIHTTGHYHIQKIDKHAIQYIITLFFQIWSLVSKSVSKITVYYFSLFHTYLLSLIICFFV